MATYICSICKQKVTYEGGLPALYPFCSVRCRRVDLGTWFREGYAIERELTPDEVPEEGAPPGA